MPTQLIFEDVNVGDEMPQLVKKAVNEVQLIRYAGASGDFNPLHTVDAMGKMAGYGGVIAHGMLVMGIVGQAITDWMPNRCLKKFGVRFTSPTKPNEVITVTGKVVEKQEDDRLIVCEVHAANQDGEVKISGRFVARLG